jgi:small neutral amino acid transporter SnatA (MarC family)
VRGERFFFQIINKMGSKQYFLFIGKDFNILREQKIIRNYCKIVFMTFLIFFKNNIDNRKLLEML